MNQPPKLASVTKSARRHRPCSSRKPATASTVSPSTVALPSAVMSSAALTIQRGPIGRDGSAGSRKRQQDLLVEALRLSFEHFARRA